ncbi:hypothetical protein C437_04920 [Haloarcula vallismortis ATCC 29715]|uniref:Uncharacterized protein n=1 Tax=Haloarcula vallismortis ATCC 29715 TaxID=662477 RepID=M0JLU2_HALVA|nr:hypothetical protein C437_04920 [Haloarcula vallismortis ATCC 29715]
MHPCTLSCLRLPHDLLIFFLSWPPSYYYICLLVFFITRVNLRLVCPQAFFCFVYWVAFIGVEVLVSGCVCTCFLHCVSLANDLLIFFLSWPPSYYY